MYNLIRAWEIRKEYRTDKVPPILSRITYAYVWWWDQKWNIKRYGLIQHLIFTFAWDWWKRRAFRQFINRLRENLVKGNTNIKDAQFFIKQEYDFWIKRRNK